MDPDLRPAFYGAILGALGVSLAVSFPLLVGLLIAVFTGDGDSLDWLGFLGTIVARAFLGGYGLVGAVLGAWLAHRWSRLRRSAVPSPPSGAGSLSSRADDARDTRELKFGCLHCDQPLACPLEWVGREIRCPSCLEELAIPFPPGQTGAEWCSRNLEARSGARHSLALAVSAWMAIILVWVWVLTRPPGTFHDQGGMVITFLVLPLTLVAWFVGGPFAAGLAKRTRKQVGDAAHLQGVATLAAAAGFLARVLTWTGIAVLGYAWWRGITA